MEKLGKVLILLYSVYSLIKISKEDHLRLFDVSRFMNYLKHVYPDIEIFSKDEILQYLKTVRILKQYINRDGCYYISADNEKLNEYIENNKEPFLINLYNTAEVFVWDMLYCGSCEHLKAVEHKYRYGWTGLDCDLYCDKYNGCLMEAVMPNDGTQVLKLKECRF